MVEPTPTRYSPEGTPLRRTAVDIRFGNSYSTETPPARKLWWRIRGVLRSAVKNNKQRH
ncbi:hypothetical protein [Streptomyces rimosus]|uniref:hypothetical protein n=1 Tax=Streptomyces rimosus TaxID=1927 RepID=UPI000A5CEE0C|nr:hypothetical protein [Streptomyces rimosus]